MIWGKEKNKMKADLKAETPEERDLVNRLEEIRTSSELQSFLVQVKSEIETLGISHFTSRVKKNGSAIRKYRVGKYENIEQIDDLCGIMIVTDNIMQVYKVAEAIKKLLNQPKSLDLNYQTEAHGVSPLSYILKSEMTFEDMKHTVPMEIRIQEKTRFITIEALYYTLYKNDMLVGNIKWDLNEVLMQIMSRQAQMEVGKCDVETTQRLQEEIRQILNDNSEILETNQQIIYEAWKEYARVSFEYAHNAEIEVSSLFDAGILGRIDDRIDQLFDEYYQELEGKELQDTEFPAGARIQNTIQKIQNMDYSDLIKMLDDTEIQKNNDLEL